MDRNRDEVTSRINVLREEVRGAYESFLGVPPSDSLSDKQVATEVSIYSRRNADMGTEEKCRELLGLIEQVEMEELISNL